MVCFLSPTSSKVYTLSRSWHCYTSLQNNGFTQFLWTLMSLYIILRMKAWAWQILRYVNSLKREKLLIPTSQLQYTFKNYHHKILSGWVQKWSHREGFLSPALSSHVKIHNILWFFKNSQFSVTHSIFVQLSLLSWLENDPIILQPLPCIFLQVS